MPRKNKYLFARKKRSQYIKEIIITAISACAAFLVILFVYFNLFGTASKVKLKDNLKAEINSEAKVSDFIDSIEDGKLKEDVRVDTTKLGKKNYQLILVINGKERNFDFDIEVVDTKAPEIQIDENINVLLGAKSKLEEMAQVSDNSGKVEVKLKGDYDSDKAGSYSVALIASDNSGNKAEKTVNINVIDLAKTEGNVSFITGKGFKGERIDGVTKINGLIIVNKTFSLPPSYGIGGIHQDAYTALEQLIAEASDKGVHFNIISGYRSYATENNLYNSYVAARGKEAADTLSAKAGHSENQTGYAVDLNSTSESFADTKEGKWLAENCAKHGYIIRYPKGKESFTGYNFEPWHIRYVGADLAKTLYNDGNWITLEEYFGITSAYSDTGR
ncbi:MAG: D-alanyl-D-alanine carboxypeptidase family protein [Eubacterium sp.]|nr:D-alanyl-D-alanine carboxypeptidase family protein [Eubacterium sp.]